MLNKIKIIGRFLPNRKKEESKREADNPASFADETKSDFDKPEERRRKPLFFSVLVTNPTNSETALRCFAEGELAERIEKENREIKENEVIVVEVKGYLRNEKNLKDFTKYDKPLYKISNEEFQKNDEVKMPTESRQILIKALEFKRLDLDFNDIDKKTSNQVRLMGKIITDLQAPQDKPDPEKLSFKLAVPREGNNSPLFFCKAKGELVPEIKQRLKKGDVILLEGFLQTKNEKKAINPSRPSSIICRGFTLLDNDSVNIFSPLDNLTRIVKEVKEIDFSQEIE
jgi:hypothetical protein